MTRTASGITPRCPRRRCARPEFLEGSAPANRIALVEFESADRAREFYHSAAYHAAREKCLTAAEFRMTLLGGPAGGPR
jgi:uncharacterized protein (DUF1330 family)